MGLDRNVWVGDVVDGMREQSYSPSSCHIDRGEWFDAYRIEFEWGGRFRRQRNGLFGDVLVWVWIWQRVGEQLRGVSWRFLGGRTIRRFSVWEFLLRE